MQRLLCTRCGDSIHPDTAQRNDGLCMPCVRGNQLTIEQRRQAHAKAREEERARLASPAYKYWSSLIDRVYKQPGGFDALARGDQLYYLVSVLSGEVHNGGFAQFFSNSSGNRYQETVEALVELGALETLELLQRAKSVEFGEMDVPAARMDRFNLMATSSEESPRYRAAELALDALDRKFYANEASLSELLDQWVIRHKLYPTA
ncbi:hypothetical protein DBR42_28250 [Pelomonas sp. HMWF004]|nr:hypothetical protein DBR42_28250 [Pelomonas sp. HMWF004]